MAVDHGDGHHHVASYAESGDAAEQADNQADAAEEFSADRQESEWRGDVHGLSEESHGARETIAAKPAKRLLRAVGKKDRAQHEAKNGDDRIVRGADKLVEHEQASLILGRKMGPTRRRCYTDFA